MLSRQTTTTACSCAEKITLAALAIPARTELAAVSLATAATVRLIGMELGGRYMLTPLGDTYCGDGCVSNCGAVAECGKDAVPSGKKCPLNTWYWSR